MVSLSRSSGQHLQLGMYLHLTFLTHNKYVIDVLCGCSVRPAGTGLNYKDFSVPLASHHRYTGPTATCSCITIVGDFNVFRFITGFKKSDQTCPPGLPVHHAPQGPPPPGNRQEPPPTLSSFRPAQWCNTRR